MAHYAAICDAVARIAVAAQMDDIKDEVRTFSILYWGKTCIYESKEVEKAQVEIHAELAKITNPKSPPPERLKSLSYKLAHACRDDLNQAFDQPTFEMDESRSDQTQKHIDPSLMRLPQNPLQLHYPGLPLKLSIGKVP